MKAAKHRDPNRLFNLVTYLCLRGNPLSGRRLFERDLRPLGLASDTDETTFLAYTNAAVNLTCYFAEQGHTDQALEIYQQDLKPLVSPSHLNLEEECRLERIRGAYNILSFLSGQEVSVAIEFYESEVRPIGRAFGSETQVAIRWAKCLEALIAYLFRFDQMALASPFYEDELIPLHDRYGAETQFSLSWSNATAYMIYHLST